MCIPQIIISICCGIFAFKIVDSEGQCDVSITLTVLFPSFERVINVTNRCHTGLQITLRWPAGAGAGGGGFPSVIGKSKSGQDGTSSHASLMFGASRGWHYSWWVTCMKMWHHFQANQVMLTMRKIVTWMWWLVVSKLGCGLGLGDIADKSLKRLKTIPDRCILM